MSRIIYSHADIGSFEVRVPVVPITAPETKRHSGRREAETRNPLGHPEAQWIGAFAKMTMKNLNAPVGHARQAKQYLAVIYQ